MSKKGKRVKSAESADMTKRLDLTSTRKTKPTQSEVEFYKIATLTQTDRINNLFRKLKIILTDTDRKNRQNQQLSLENLKSF